MAGCKLQDVTTTSKASAKAFVSNPCSAAAVRQAWIETVCFKRSLSLSISSSSLIFLIRSCTVLFKVSNCFAPTLASAPQ